MPHLQFLIMGNRFHRNEALWIHRERTIRHGIAFALGDAATALILQARNPIIRASFVWPKIRIHRHLKRVLEYIAVTSINVRLSRPTFDRKKIKLFKLNKEVLDRQHSELLNA